LTVVKVIELIGAGGSPGYSYSIDGGTTYVTPNVFSGLVAGEYSVSVRDPITVLAFIWSPSTSRK